MLHVEHIIKIPPFGAVFFYRCYRNYKCYIFFTYNTYSTYNTYISPSIYQTLSA